MRQRRRGIWADMAGLIATKYFRWLYFVAAPPKSGISGQSGVKRKENEFFPVSIFHCTMFGPWGVNSSAIIGCAVLGSEARSLIVPHLGAPREAKMGDERCVPGCEAGLGGGGAPRRRYWSWWLWWQLKQETGEAEGRRWSPCGIH